MRGGQSASNTCPYAHAAIPAKQLDMNDIRSNGEGSRSSKVSTSTSHVHVVFAGAVAGLVTRLAIAPFDVVKIRIQLQPDRTRGILFHTLQSTIQQEGFLALWKGNLAASYLYISYSAAQFYAFEGISGVLSAAGLSATSSTLISGGLAGCVGTIATYPLDLLRTRFAAQGPRGNLYPSFWSACKHIYQREGFIRGFYKGATASVLQIGPQMAIMFEAHRFLLFHGDQLMSQITQETSQHNRWYVEMLAGGASGVLSKSLVMPFDVVRKRLQVQGPDRKQFVLGNVPSYTGGFLTTAQRIWRYEGIYGLYKGLAVSLIKSGLSSAITFVTFAECKRLFARFSVAK